MSIIEKSNPLNLQYKICVVTNASSSLGVVICKTLLKANALVLGIDKNPRHESLNAGLGTHFQFECRDINDPETPETIIAASREKFESLGGKFDVLVNLLWPEDLEGIKNLTKAIGNVMKESGNAGSIITVPGELDMGGNDSDLVELTRSIAREHSVRANMIAVQDNHRLEENKQAYEEAKTHMTALIKTERPAIQAKQVPPNFYHVGNLVLFLAGSMSEDISGQLVALDGSYRVL